MWLSLIGITFDTIGTILIAYTAFKVHDRVRADRKINSMVLKEMGREKNLGMIGILLIIIGYIFQLLTFFIL